MYTFRVYIEHMNKHYKKNIVSFRVTDEELKRLEKDVKTYNKLVPRKQINLTKLCRLKVLGDTL